MRTGLTKQQKTTEIYFDELPNGGIAVCTHNTDLKKRLTSFTEQYPDHCTTTDEASETGYKVFEVEKERLSFRLTVRTARNTDRQQAIMQSRTASHLSDKR